MTVREDRTARSARNAGVGVVTQGLNLLLSLITRTVFIGVLGSSLLGVQTLLMSVLAVLAVADLGLNGAISYALYQPLAQNDDHKVASIVEYASRLYRRVALAVACIGLALLPVLPVFFAPGEFFEEIRVFYIILLANTIVSYVMVPRSILVSADQRQYLTRTYQLLFNVVRTGVQISILLVWHSFLGFLVAGVIATALTNYAIYRRAGRLYPFLSGRATALPIRDRSAIRESVRAVLIYRVGGVVLNNSDPILISMLVGTLILGQYSNYLLIIGSFAMIAEIAFSSIAPSVGNLVAQSKHEIARARSVLDEIALLAVLLYGTLALVFAMSLDEIVTLWIGADNLIPGSALWAAAANFYLVGVMSPISTFRAATGMFKQTRYVYLLTAVINVVLSVALGSVFGLTGILVATAIARLVTNTWYEPFVLFSRHLDGGAGRYLRFHLLVLVILAFTAASSWVVGRGFDSAASAAIASGVSAAVTFLVLMLAAFGRSMAAASLRRRFRHVLRRS